MTPAVRIGKLTKTRARRLTLYDVVTRAERDTHRQVLDLRRQLDAIAVILAETRQRLNRLDVMEHPDHVDDDVLVLRPRVLRHARVAWRESLLRAWRHLADPDES
jgi:hypothetical protein